MRPPTRTMVHACLVVAALGSTIPAKAYSRAGSPIPAPTEAPPSSPIPAHAPTSADASVLYNVGTDALARGDLGLAVGFLEAAHRIEPRAGDIRSNLAIARVRAAEMHGVGSEQSRPSLPSALALSPVEAWWLAAALVAIGALAGTFGTLRAGRRSVALAGIGALALGAALWGGLFLRAREEARHPEAVVVVPMLDVGPAPDERPRPPYLLGAGEEVRLGRPRGELVEIRVGGNAIGWAQRSGLWRVADVPGYTSSLQAR